MEQSPGIGRILSRDWPAFGLLVLAGFCVVLAAAVYLGVAVFAPADAEGWQMAYLLTGVALAAIAGCGPVVVWRVRTIRRVFATGERITGRVVYVGENSEDVGYAVINYQYLGQDYQIRQVTEGTDAKKELTEKAPVELIVNPRQPSQAFVAVVYL